MRRHDEKKRLNESAERHYARDRPRKEVPTRQCFMNWSEIEPNRRGRRFSGSYIHTTSLKNKACDITTPLQAFQILFDNAMLEKIVTYTNKQIAREVERLRSENYLSQSFHRPVDKIELNAFFSTCYYIALYKKNKF